MAMARPLLRLLAVVCGRIDAQHLAVKIGAPAAQGALVSALQLGHLPGAMLARFV